ncbi:CYFA0S05e03598g1_1 [Cyberlindnera fabianii]|uniref:Protein HGH1 homolog n=1 Tax=Cyberlindnera fabianii TaxID=36022 RepID=A0A061AU54_CYBFA|nr:Protein HGH1 [Cyberlindnera fabianii]CDR40713.1 CYFA0S05e03598g1_1 [Cyberlindnera fabianii]
MAKSELEELAEFLHHEQAPIRAVALENLVGFCQGPHSKVFYQDNYRPIKDLKILALSKGNTIIQNALTILVNLSGDEAVRDILASDDGFLKNMIRIVLDLENRNADLAAIMLTNIAKHDNAKKIFEFEIETKNSEVFKSKRAIDCLVDVFVKGMDNALNKSANFDYLAYLFADLSRFIEGRKYFVTKQDYDGVVPITKLVVFTEKYDNKTRREGVASTIKNALFEVEAHLDLLDESDANLLPYLLLPIATSKDAELDEEELFDLPDELQLLPEDKVRDPNPEIICVHLESLLLLCTTRQVRDYLRSKSVYPLVRELHKNVEHEAVQDMCDKLVQMLKRDEGVEQVEEIITKEAIGDASDDEVMKEEDDSDEDDDALVEVL